MSMMSRATILVAGGLLGACASAPPVPTEYYAGVVSQVAAQHSALIVSSCVIRDEIGSDLFAVDTARLRAGALMSEAQAYLVSQGINLNVPPVMMMCAGYIPDSKEDMPRFVADFRHKDVTVDGGLPYLYDANSLGNVSAAADLHGLFDQAYQMHDSHIDKAGETPAAENLVLRADAVARIRQATAADYLWLLTTDSTEVSTGKKMGTVVLTAVLSLGTVATAPTGGSMNMVALVDLREGRIIWKKTVGSMHGSSTTTAAYTGGSAPVMTTNNSGGSAPTASTRAVALFAPLLAGDRVVGTPATATVAAAAPAALAAPSPAASVEVKPSGMVLLHNVALLSTPLSDGSVVGNLVAGTQVKVQSSVVNASGQWSYVSTADAQGWIKASDLSAH